MSELFDERMIEETMTTGIKKGETLISPSIFNAQCGAQCGVGANCFLATSRKLLNLNMRLAGLEPAAYCLGGSRSIHLSYKRGKISMSPEYRAGS
jgi:hypothetical protein